MKFCNPLAPNDWLIPTPEFANPIPPIGNIFKVLDGIENLGNVSFRIVLGFTNDEIIQLFWLKKVQLIRDNQKSENRRDNIPEEIYSKLFNYIIEEINIKIWKNNSPNNNANNNVNNDTHNNDIK